MNILRVWKMADRKTLFILQILTQVGLAVITIVVSDFARETVDNGIGEGKVFEVFWQFLIITFIGIGLSYSGVMVRSAFSIDLIEKLRNLINEKLLNCKYAYFENESSGSIHNKILHDMSCVAEYMAGGLPEFLSNMVIFICCFMYLLTVNLSMTLVSAICIPLAVVVAKKIAAPTYDTMEKFDKKMDEVIGIAQDTLNGIKIEKAYNLKGKRKKYFDDHIGEATSYFIAYEKLVVKAGPYKYIIKSAPIFICIMLGFAFNILTLTINTTISKKLKGTTKEIQNEMSNMTVTIGNIIGGMSIIRMYQLASSMQEQFKKNNREVSRLSLKNSKITAFLSAYNFFISMLNIMVFLLVGTIMVKHGLTTYGNILAIMSLQTALDAQFREFGQYYPLFYNSFAGTERIYDFLGIEEEPLTRQAEKIDQPEYIQFKDVTFGYTHDTLILKQFNLSIKKGETLALIGASGSGKSSVAKLLLGFYTIHSGGISVGGKNISDMTLTEMRDMIAYVPQEATLFNTTIMENIRYGREDATDEEIFEAAQLANADSFIRQQPQGYETFVGERGIRLSGGQCQRIAIARAILKDAPILLLDEATSALDSESEGLIKETIEAYGKSRTTIIIAHRLSTIEHADRVFRMGED